MRKPFIFIERTENGARVTYDITSGGKLDVDVAHTMLSGINWSELDTWAIGEKGCIDEDGHLQPCSTCQVKDTCPGYRPINE